VIVDYHMHLRDRAEEAPGGRYRLDHLERYVERAARAGVDEIGFTEHVYHFRQTHALWEIPWMLDRCTDDLDEYVGTVDEARRQGLPVKLGLEVDYFPGTEAALLELLAAYEWDYLLGSVHFVDGFPVDQRPALTEKLPAAEAWRRYFVWLRNAARSGLFDALSHPDIVKFFGVRPADGEATHFVYEETADAVEAAGLCVEISTKGLRVPVGELYPDPELLRAFHDRGAPITLASDAHEPEDVGRDFDRALELARAAGYNTVTVFERRQRRQEPLG
jgi:histidinol-phosphatase (PHP family)